MISASFGHCGARVTGIHGRPQRESAAPTARLPAVFWSSSARSAGAAGVAAGASFSLRRRFELLLLLQLLLAPPALAPGPHRAQSLNSKR